MLLGKETPTLFELLCKRLEVSTSFECKSTKVGDAEKGWKVRVLKECTLDDGTRRAEIEKTDKTPLGWVTSKRSLKRPLKCWTRELLQGTSPVKLLAAKPVWLYFIEPETQKRALTNNGSGFKLWKTKDTAKELAPAIALSLALVKVLSVVASVAPVGAVVASTLTKPLSDIDQEIKCGIDPEIARNKIKEARRDLGNANLKIESQEYVEQLLGAAHKDWKTKTGLEKCDDRWVCLKLQQEEAASQMSQAAGIVESGVTAAEVIAKGGEAYRRWSRPS